MTWHVVFATALSEWDERDDSPRRALVLWLERLAENGPPLLYEVDETARYLRTIAPTGHVVEYFVIRAESRGVIAVLKIRPQPP